MTVAFDQTQLSQGHEIKNIPISEIFVDNDFNCRGDNLTPISCIDLAKSIEARGLIQPITVKHYSDPSNPTKKWKLIAGFRRVMAHILLKAQNITAIIRDDIDTQADMILFNLVENFERTDLTILEEARSLLKLQPYGLDRDDLVRKLGKSSGWIDIRLKVLDLPAEVQAEVAAGYIKQSQIKELHAIYRAAGTVSLYEAVKKIKDKKLKGINSQDYKLRAPKAAEKKLRIRGEMLELQNIIRDNFGNGVGTRTLAWCMGEITTGDLFDTLKSENGGTLIIRPELEKYTAVIGEPQKSMFEKI